MNFCLVRSSPNIGRFQVSSSHDITSGPRRPRIVSLSSSSSSSLSRSPSRERSRSSSTEPRLSNKHLSTMSPEFARPDTFQRFQTPRDVFPKSSSSTLRTPFQFKRSKSSPAIVLTPRPSKFCGKKRQYREDDDGSGLQLSQFSQRSSKSSKTEELPFVVPFVDPRRRVAVAEIEALSLVELKVRAFWW